MKSIKVVALVPFKNEAHNLPSFMENMQKVADEILGYDDNSHDDSAAIFQSMGGRLIKERVRSDFAQGGQYQMRNFLLNAGRRAKGTHFVILDADEVFSNTFTAIGKETISQLHRNQILQLNWISCWESFDSFCAEGSPWAPKYHDFIFCDDETSHYPPSGLHFGRVPAGNFSRLRLPEHSGAVLHKQFLSLQDFEIKQCLYRMNELLEGSHSAVSINQTYAVTRRLCSKPTPIPSHWRSTECRFDGTPNNWRLQEVENLFAKFGVKTFESLDIWHSEILLHYWHAQYKRKPKIRQKSPLIRRILASALRLVRGLRSIG
jgi:hypothetical protein